MKENIEGHDFINKMTAIFTTNIFLNSTPPEDQKPYLVGEEWSFMLIPEDIESNNSRLRAATLKMEREGLRTFPYRFDNIEKANQMIMQLLAKISSNGTKDFKISEIEQPRGIDNDTKIYLLAIVRPILKYGTPPPGYKFSLEVGYYLPASM